MFQTYANFELSFCKMLLSLKRKNTKMIGKEGQNEEVVLKVTDRRKFNPDGSVREGVEIEKPAETGEMKAAEGILIGASPSPGETSTHEDFSAYEQDEEAEELKDIPGADEPASFVNFLTTLASQAAATLGAVPHPVTGQRTVDLETGRYWIDVLAMLKEKTKSNLHEKEAQLLDGLLSDLRMQYVMLARATEEKLKKQAAQKFSASDILGKK
jgi:hypothetical protein